MNVLCRMLIKAFIAAFCMMLPQWACAQSIYTWEQFLEDYTAYVLDLEEEEFENSDDETIGVLRYNWIEDLEEIHNNPIDINRAERSELEALHFLDDEQIDSLLTKRDRYRGGFRSLGELMTVPQLSYRDRAWLSLLVKFVPLSQDYSGMQLLQENGGTYSSQNNQKFDNKWYGGKHEIVGTLNLPLYRRAGFYDYNSDNYPSKMFLGQRFGHTLRYRYNWRQRVRYGITVQQDVGERFASYGSRPWDYQSAYFYFRSDPERYVFKLTDRDADHPSYRQKHSTTVSRYEVAIGDYHLNLGRGLVVGSRSWNNESSLLQGVRLDEAHIRPNTGCDENSFLRGAAATVRVGRRAEWSLTGFGSWRQIDGTVKGMALKNNFDNTLSDTITAWKTDGLHRTIQEVNKRNVAQQLLLGGRVGYQNSWLSVAINGAWVHYDKVYYPSPRTYNRYYLRGKDAAALSLDYSFLRRYWSLQGEIAMDREGACAATTTLHVHPSRALSFVLQERSFAHDYVTPYGNTFQANSQLQNEHGLFFGIRYAGIKRLELIANLDGSLHPRPVYLADTLSHRFAAMAQIIFHPNPKWTHTMRYRMRNRQQNVTGYKDIPSITDALLSWRCSHHLRLQSSWNIPKYTVCFGVEASSYYAQAKSYDKKTGKLYGHGTNFGGLLFLRTLMSPFSRFRCSAALVGFCTANYDTRCSVFLPQLQGVVSLPSFYGKGASGVAACEYNIFRGLRIAAHFSSTKYFDRKEIGSAQNRINSSWKNDLLLQARWIF